MSAVEKVVDSLNKLRKEAAKIEDGMCGIRLGGEVEMQFKRFFWKDMVIAHGWGHQKSEPLPQGIEREFYLFLDKKLGKVNAEIRAVEATLAEHWIEAA